MLADAEWVNKAASNRSEQINTCIACNQACLDHTFQLKRASCLVNPRACHETELVFKPTAKAKKIAVIGAGPAGLSCATAAADCGHDVHLFDQADKIGGQFNLAKTIPGKEEFDETLRYFGTQIERSGVKLTLNHRVAKPELINGAYDDIVIATGVSPRALSIPGIDHPKVVSYIDVLKGNVTIGKRVALIGAGGIGFDVAEYLAHDHSAELPQSIASWSAEWGIDQHSAERGGLVAGNPEPSQREIFLLQRKTTALGKDLGKTSGWVHRATLKNKGVNMLAGCSYDRIDDQGLHISQDGKQRLLEVDHIVICAGQEPLRELYNSASEQDAKASPRYHLIGGANIASELDAKRAIREGAELAASF